MGKTRVSIRTLPSGERVKHYPPCDEYPEGKMVLIRDGSALAAQLETRRDMQDEAMRDMKTAHRARVAVKQEAEAAHPAVPPEKRFI